MSNQRSEPTSDGSGSHDSGRGQRQTPDGLTLVKVREIRPEGYEGSCLRPLGLCELGGCCDACWYSPDHPRFKKRS